MPFAQYTPSSPGGIPRLDQAAPSPLIDGQIAQAPTDQYHAAGKSGESLPRGPSLLGEGAGGEARGTAREGVGGETTKILAIRPGALGDALLAWPALALLRRLAPSTHLHLVSRADVLSLALSSGLADAASAYDDPRWLGLFAPALPPPPEVASTDAVVAWLDDPGGAVAARLRAICCGRVLVLPGRPDPMLEEHAALHLLRPLAAWGLPTPATGTPPADLRSWLPPLEPGDEAREAVARWWEAQGLGDGECDGAAPVVALHAGSGGAAKRWPAERFGLLAAELDRQGMRPILISGPQDAEVSAAVQAAAGMAGLANLPEARGFRLAEVVALLQRCAAFVGNDSGVTHLTGLLGMRTLALFGPTDPTIWAPLGGHVLRAPEGDMANLGLAEVASAVARLLN